jgi:hypothetical protein
MTHRIWLILLVLYLIATAADGSYRIVDAGRNNQKLGPAVFAVAFCAGLFWPVDIVARSLLTRG